MANNNQIEADLLSDEACKAFWAKLGYKGSLTVDVAFDAGWQEAARLAAIELRQICKERDNKHATEINHLRDLLKFVLENDDANWPYSVLEWRKQAHAALEGK